MPTNQISSDTSAPCRLVVNPSAFLNVRSKAHPDLLENILREVRVPQQAPHKSPQQMPVPDKAGSGIIDLLW